MKVYEVEVTVTGAQPPRGQKITGLTYLIRCESEIDAKVEALNRARRSKAEHPGKFRNAEFSCKENCCKDFK